MICLSRSSTPQLEQSNMSEAEQRQDDAKEDTDLSRDGSLNSTVSRTVGSDERTMSQSATGVELMSSTFSESSSSSFVSETFRKIRNKIRHSKVFASFLSPTDEYASNTRFWTENQQERPGDDLALSIVLGDKKLSKLFDKFCRKCHCSENLHFYSAVTEYRATSVNAPPYMRRVLVEIILDKFIRMGSPEWVCLPTTIVKKIEAELATYDLASFTGHGIFDEAQKEVKRTLVMDVLPRFIARYFED